MVDSLCEAKELALNEINPLIFSIATLTGHAMRSYGSYSVRNFKKNVYIYFLFLYI